MALTLPGRRRVYRDPIHGNLDFRRDGFHELFESLVDTSEFQRLRSIRQNGVTNLVFHGLEHSRFAHSMGVAWLAGRIFNSIRKNSDLDGDLASVWEDTVLAALLHDIGHGPFSHTIEQVLGELGHKFDHEKMTARFIREEGSEINRLLAKANKGLPDRLVAYIEKTARAEPKWWHNIVSSRLDADRLDYLLRDAYMAGVRTHRVDIWRLIAAMGVHEGRIVVDGRATDVVESFLLGLDQMYEAVYFHKTVRAAACLLTSTIKRAVVVSKDKKQEVFPAADDPFQHLVEAGNEVPLASYVQLDDHHVWTLISGWRRSSDPLLAYLANNLKCRRFPKAVSLANKSHRQMNDLQEEAERLCKDQFPDLDPKYLVTLDEPDRVSYKRYTLAEGPAESIWVLNPERAQPIEELDRTIAKKLADKIYLPRLLVPTEIRADVEAARG